jgi:uncharacterized membrane protein YphA (DoxX/SURF4 family)
MSSSSIASPEPAPRALWGKRIGLAAMTVARLGLALGMLPYGISKLCDFQFQAGASNYAQPLGEIPGTILTWAFLGYSPVFQFLMGAFETVPAIMLLFARTQRLGALLLFPVLLNVWDSCRACWSNPSLSPIGSCASWPELQASWSPPR